MRSSELGDIVEFVIVADSGDEFAGSRGLVSVVFACFHVGAVAHLFGFREGEEGLADGELTFDLGVGEAVVFDVEEACLGLCQPTGGKKARVKWQCWNDVDIFFMLLRLKVDL